MAEEKVSELLGCPFCESEVVAVGRLVAPSHPATPYQASCGTCGASGPEMNTERAAAAAWNRCRPVQGDVLPKLANCGHYLAEDNTGQWHYINHANTWQSYPGPSTPEARAMLSASPSPPKADGSGEVNVKPLEWQQNWPSDPLTGYAPVEPLNRYYLVDHDEPRFYAKSAVFGTDNHDKFLGNFGSFDEAKAAAQSDYEARILSALSPSIKREA